MLTNLVEEYSLELKGRSLAMLTFAGNGDQALVELSRQKRPIGRLQFGVEVETTLEKNKARKQENFP